MKRNSSTPKTQGVNGSTDLQALSSFIESTKEGDYTKNFPELLKITLGRTDLPTGSEHVLPYINDQDIILFGLSY